MFNKRYYILYILQCAEGKLIYVLFAIYFNFVKAQLLKFVNFDLDIKNLCFWTFSRNIMEYFQASTQLSLT